MLARADSEADTSRGLVAAVADQDGLAAEGLLVSRQGSGNFVCTRIDKNFAKLTSFSEDMRARGRLPRSIWLKADGETPSVSAARLKLSNSPTATNARN